MSAPYSIKQIATALGGDVVGPDRAMVPGPGHSPKDRSLAVKLDPTRPDGFVVHSFAGDDFRLCCTHVLAAIGAGPTHLVAAGATLHASTQNGKSSFDGAIRLWSEASDPKGTLAEQYLSSRHLKLPTDVIDAIRFHSACPFGPNNRVPCMISLFRDIDTDEPRAILRTALTVDGQKFDRRVLGPKSGCAIKLTPAAKLQGLLTIGEGLETTLAGIAYGFEPAWCVGDAGALAKFPVIPGISRLTILVDNDANGTGLACALKCTERWKAAGVEVWHVIPESIDADIADLVVERAA